MVTVRLFAAAAEASGLDETQVTAGTVRELRERLTAQHDDEFERVLRQCVIMIGGRRSDDDAVIAPGAIVDVLPPFAGG